MFPLSGMECAHKTLSDARRGYSALGPPPSTGRCSHSGNSNLPRAYSRSSRSRVQAQSEHDHRNRVGTQKYCLRAALGHCGRFGSRSRGLVYAAGVTSHKAFNSGPGAGAEAEAVQRIVSKSDSPFVAGQAKRIAGTDVPRCAEAVLSRDRRFFRRAHEFSSNAAECARGGRSLARICV